MIRWVFEQLREPILEELDIDGQDRLALHAAVLAQKPMLRGVFTEIHRAFRTYESSFVQADGIAVEVGAGVAPMRESYADVLATDFVYGRHLDCVIDAEAMAITDGSVRVLFGQNCFHHFAHPKRFFSELDRVLAPGGAAILLEPYHGLIAEILFRRMFSSEGFDKAQLSWNTPVTGPMNGANQALSYIVFERDRNAFERMYPSLRIAYHECAHSYLRYVLSGGVNFRQIVPDRFIRILEFLEDLLWPLRRWVALHQFIVIVKSTV